MNDQTAPASDDDAAITAQLGRAMRAPSQVASRCHLRLPIVAKVPPVLNSGEPFPTHYWLTCPLAHRRIARLESAGGVRAYDARVQDDPAFAKAVAGAHSAYAKERDRLVPDSMPHPPRGGVAGAAGSGIKCLHAHYAHHRGGGENPIGAEVAASIEPLNCASGCVADGKRSPDWREPQAKP
ncbi:MAG: DUF501 domain-containing protein [Myxococcota bacterium]